jgi:hypothetical protein
MPTKKWTEGEDQVLRSKLNTMPLKDLAFLLKRTKAAVIGRSHRLGLQNVRAMDDEPRKWRTLEQRHPWRPGDPIPEHIRKSWEGEGE